MHDFIMNRKGRQIKRFIYDSKVSRKTLSKANFVISEKTSSYTKMISREWI